MVVSQKLGPVEVVEMEHSIPQGIVFLLEVSPDRVDLERDVSRAANCLNRPQVLFAQIGFVRRHFPHLEILSRGLDEGSQVWGIVGRGFGDLDGGDDVGLGAAKQMGLDPLGLFNLTSPLVVEPAVIGRCGETAGVHGEVGFNGLERQCALLDKRLEQGASTPGLPYSGMCWRRKAFCQTDRRPRR